MLPINYMGVNWQNGMKIKSGHFIALENYFKDSIRDSMIISMGEYSYGLLPPIPGEPTQLKLRCDAIPGNKIKVVLMACRAITAGGIRIERTEKDNTVSGSEWIETTYPTNKTSENELSKLDIIISVEPFSRIAVGDPDPDENPPRRPWVCLKYALRIHPLETPINVANELKIGEIIIENEVAKISETYIPACSRVTSYAPLKDIYHNFETALSTIENKCAYLLQQFRSGFMLKGADSRSLRSQLQFFAEKILFFLASNFDGYRNIVPHSSPIWFVEFFMRLARVITNTLKCMDSMAKDTLLNYFKQWGPGFEPGKFELALSEIINSDYDHQNIRTNIEKIEAYLNPLVKLFEILSEHEIEGTHRQIITRYEEHENV